MREESLLTGPLEPTNQWYALAKISALKLCQAYRRQYGLDFTSVMPTNLYGPGDTFDLNSGHVVPALLRKTHEAAQRGEPTVPIWGTGRPRREFLHVDDCADALVFLMKHYSGEEHLNVGTGSDITIRELADLIGRVVGYRGQFVYDTSRPDGSPQKRLDVTRLAALGWRATIDLETGLRQTYDWYKRKSESESERMARSAASRAAVLLHPVGLGPSSVAAPDFEVHRRLQDAVLVAMVSPEPRHPLPEGRFHAAGRVLIVVGRFETVAKRLQRQEQAAVLRSEDPRRGDTNSDIRRGLR